MIKHQTSPEVEIMERIVDGKSAAFESLIRSYNPYLYKIGRTFGFMHQDAEDLMEETFVSAYKNLSKLADKMYFKTWLTRIMLYECYKRANSESLLEGKMSEIALNEKTVFMLSTNNNNNNPATTARSRELSLVIENAIRQIPMDYRLVFSLRELNCMSVSDTANALDITEANVNARLGRAKAMLRKEIEKMYTPEDIFEFNLVYCDGIVDRVMRRITKQENHSK